MEAYVHNMEIQVAFQLRAIMDEIPDGVSVADLACGSGYMLRKLREEKNCEVVGYDFSKTVMDILAKKGIKGILADLRNYEPVNGEKYHTVILSHVVEHLTGDDLHNMLRTAARMTGEQCLVLVPAEENLYAFCSSL